MKTLSTYREKTLLGKVNGENIYLYAPKWDCGWYWGFGYLGNNRCHYHVDGLMKDCDLYTGFKNHFGDTFLIKESDIWVFAELFKTFYLLKKCAELYKDGGAHYTTNPIKDLIINTDEVERINSVLLPALFEEIYKVIARNLDNKETFAKIASLNLEGDTQKIIEYMKKKGIKTDDLKSIKELNLNDFNVIHSYYWKDFHKNK